MSYCHTRGGARELPGASDDLGIRVLSGAALGFGTVRCYWVRDNRFPPVRLGESVVSPHGKPGPAGGASFPSAPRIGRAASRPYPASRAGGGAVHPRTGLSAHVSSSLPPQGGCSSQPVRKCRRRHQPADVDGRDGNGRARGARWLERVEVRGTPPRPVHPPRHPGMCGGGPRYRSGSPRRNTSRFAGVICICPRHSARASASYEAF